MGRHVDGPPAPYIVQAYRPGQFETWAADSKHEQLEAAVAAARVLHAPPWNRKVRVIDQNEVVHLRLPPRRRK